MKTTFLLLLTLAVVATARAQAPVNDEFTNATVIPSLPYAASENTALATIAPPDPFCGGRGTTVWFSFTPTNATGIEANTFGSDYDTTLSVYTGTYDDYLGPFGLRQIFCNDDAQGLPQSQVRFTAVAGTTYHFMVASFSGLQGGNLVFSANPGPTNGEPIQLTLTAAPTAQINASDGTVTINCTVTSTRQVAGTIRGRLTQKHGGTTLEGFFGAFFPCEFNVPVTVKPTCVSQSALFSGRASGAFVAGSALVEMVVVGEDPGTRETGDAGISGSLQLIGRRR
jgi:hypothetical protein